MMRSKIGKTGKYDVASNGGGAREDEGKYNRING